MAPASPGPRPPSPELLSHDKHRTTCLSQNRGWRSPQLDPERAQDCANVDITACPTLLICAPPSLWGEGGAAAQVTQLCDSHLYRKHINQSGEILGEADPRPILPLPSQGAQEKALVGEPSRRVDCPSW